jgi:hypothetical protein
MHHIDFEESEEENSEKTSVRRCSVNIGEGCNRGSTDETPLRRLVSCLLRSETYGLLNNDEDDPCQILVTDVQTASSKAPWRGA